MSVDASGPGAFAYTRSAAVSAAPRVSRGYKADRPAYSYTAHAAVYAAARRDVRAPHRLPLPIFILLSVMIVAILYLPSVAQAASRTAFHLSAYQDRNTTTTMLDALAPTPQPARAQSPPATEVQAHKPKIERPAVSGRLSDYNLSAPPSISAATIDSVLASYSSPAAGSGATFYDLGLKYGIDPAYALAFYIHESSAGTKGVARFTHGIGNIRTTPGYADYEGYRSYASYADGIEDWFKLIKELYIGGWGLATPDAIIPRYAPWGDNNNPSVYAASVKSLVDSWQTK
ncbi:MAG: glucosaminidase domain-containing protein [Chloroflexia bacterium]